MKRREFFASLLVAPAAIVAAPKISALVPLGVAGHDIPKGETIYMKSDVIDWGLPERYKPWGDIHIQP
jgi:hypothetical protein